MGHKISVLITKYNCEKNIRRAIESVKWCDEIIVVDSYSDDKTIAIAEEYNPRIFYYIPRTIYRV